MRRIAVALALVAGLAGRTFAQCPSQSAAAVPQTPQSQNIATSTPIAYTWSAPAAGGVTGFEVLVSNGTSTTSACSAAANATSCAGAALAAGNYSWAVRTNVTGCAGGVLSAAKTFTVGCPTAAPSLQSPANGATNVSTTVTLTWTAVPGADSYDIYMGAAGTGCSGQPVATSSTTSFNPPQLTASKAYEWKVAARLSGTTCPAVPSSCFTFTTAGTTCNAPGGFSLSSPSNGGTVSTTPTLTWGASSGADKYLVHISTTNPPPASTSDPIVSASSGTSYKPTLQPGTYYWYVDAYPACSTTLKTSSQVSSFVVVSACPTNAPTLVSPVGGAQVNATQPIAFQWTAADSAPGYDIDVSSDGGNTFASIGTTTGNTATTFTKNLNPGSYVWVVRALYGTGCPAVTSGAATFTAVTPSSNCPTTPATLQLPANNAANLASPVTFDWSDVAGATSYRLIASFNGGTPAAIAVTTDSEAVVSVPGGSVEWWVEANAGTTCSGVTSQHSRFSAAGSTTNCPTSPGTPALTSPANGASVTSPVTLQWTAVSGASSYRVYAATATDRVILGTTTSTQMTTSLPQGSITWLIEAQFNGCPSTFSATSTFTITTPTTCSSTPATLQSPQNGTKNVASPVTFQWNGVQGASGYKLFIGTSATDGDLVTTTTDTQVRNLALPAGTYFWWVDTTFPGCPDVHATPFTFTIPSATSCGGGAINLGAPANGATVSSPVTLQWSALAGVTGYRIWAALNGGSPVVLARSNNASQQVSVPSGTVEWWVEGLFDNCPSVLSAHSTFTVQQSSSCGGNAAPVLTSPVNNATASSPVEFDWNAAPGASAYRVWISVGGDPFTDIGFTKLTKLTHAVDPGTVQWYVEAIYDGCAPVPSAKATFTIPAPPSCGNDAPMIISPADGAQNVLAPVTLVWSAVPNATQYRVFASLDGGDTRLIATTAEATVTKNLPPGTIKWHVEAIFEGCPATKSAKAAFTIAKNPKCDTTAAAQLVSPHDGAQNLSEPVHLDWNPVNGAVGYVVTVKHDDGVATHIAETTATELTHDFPPGDIEWWVTTFFAGCPTLESQHQHFSVAPPPDCAAAVKPILESPPDTPTPIASPVHFVWSRVPKAKSYKVWVAVDGGAATVFGNTADDKLKVDVPSGAIIWFVEATFDNCPSTKSAPGAFVVRKSAPPCGTPARPHASVPGQVASGTPYEVTWTADDNAESYELQEATNAAFTNATTQVINGVTATFTKTTTTGAQRFFYRVRAESSCSDEKSGYSATASVVVLPPAANAATTHHSSVQVGTASGLTQQVFLPGVTPAVQFTARGDKPWITVSPSSGTLGPSGVTLTVTFDAGAMKLGTNTGTIVLTYSGSGKSASPNGAAPTGVPVSISLVTPVTPGGTNTPPPDALIIPAVGHAPGANNSMFESDVRVANTGATLQKYTVTFTLTGADGTQSSQSTTVQIDPGATLALDDILASFFGIGGDGTAATGSLQIRPATSATSNLSSSGPPSIQTVASSRTYDNTPNGTYGQYIPAIPFAQFIGKSTTSTPTMISLQQIANSAAYRTNFGLVEGAGEAASVLVHVFDNSGHEVTSPIPITLKPSQQIQLNGFLAANNISLSDGRIEVEVTSSTGKVTAYASVVDNTTNDPLLVLPVVKGALSSTRYVLPGIGDLNNGNANWRSDVRLFNAGANPANVTLGYVPQPGYSGTTRTVTYTIQPGEVKVLDNAMQTLYGLTNSFGALILTSDAAASLVSTARTYNDTGNGTYGQFIAGVSPAESVGNGDRALQILQLESSSRYRTNIGIVETTGNPATVQVTAVTPDSKVSATAVIPLNANDFKQFSLDSFGLGTLYNTRVSVKVIDGTGRVTAYGSVIDATTQDPTYVPAQ